MVDAGPGSSVATRRTTLAIEFYNGGFIHYGLGNFLFDQMWSLGRDRSASTVTSCMTGGTCHRGAHLHAGGLRPAAADDRRGAHRTADITVRCVGLVGEQAHRPPPCP